MNIAERIMMDEAFQAALQRYAHGNGSSAGVANAAARVIAKATPPSSPAPKE